MGKTGKWFRSLLGSKKSPGYSPTTTDKKKSIKNVENFPAIPRVQGLDANNHAIAVAAATAAVAEAALAAARAAAAVDRLTSGGGSRRSYGSGERRRVVAAVKLQSAFRAYLARRALRALKGLVKLQALVRGHIVRKQSANMLCRMQAMARIQARTSAHRNYVSEPSNAKIKYYKSRHPGIVSLGKYEQRPNGAKQDGSLLKQHTSRSHITNNIKETSQIDSSWLDHWMASNHRSNTLKSSPGEDEKDAKILEIDTWKPHKNTNYYNETFPTPQHFSSYNNDHSKIASLSRTQNPNPSISSEEVSSVISSNFHSPRVHSASSRPTRGTFTPTRSECSRSLFGDYLNHPSYMANTESSRAKVRSQSVPKQRQQFEEQLSMSLNLGRSFWESDAYSEMGSILPENYTYLKRHGSTYGYSL